MAGPINTNVASGNLIRAGARAGRNCAALPIFSMLFGVSGIFFQSTPQVKLPVRNGLEITCGAGREIFKPFRRAIELGSPGFNLGRLKF